MLTSIKLSIHSIIKLDKIEMPFLKLKWVKVCMVHLKTLTDVLVL